MSCVLCLAMTGRFNANLECCQLRLLAGAPRERRQQAYARVRQAEGATAEAQLRSKVLAEFQRQEAWVQAIKQLEDDEQTANGRAQVSAILKAMKEKSMHVPTIRRPVAATSDALQLEVA